MLIILLQCLLLKIPSFANSRFYHLFPPSFNPSIFPSVICFHPEYPLKKGAKMPRTSSLGIGCKFTAETKITHPIGVLRKFVGFTKGYFAA
jgi:hypothetical protein